MFSHFHSVFNTDAFIGPALSDKDAWFGTAEEKQRGLNYILEMKDSMHKAVINTIKRELDVVHMVEQIDTPVFLSDTIDDAKMLVNDAASWPDMVQAASRLSFSAPRLWDYISYALINEPDEWIRAGKELTSINVLSGAYGKNAKAAYQWLGQMMLDACLLLLDLMLPVLSDLGCVLGQWINYCIQQNVQAAVELAFIFEMEPFETSMYKPEPEYLQKTANAVIHLVLKIQKKYSIQTLTQYDDMFSFQESLPVLIEKATAFLKAMPYEAYPIMSGGVVRILHPRLNRMVLHIARTYSPHFEKAQEMLDATELITLATKVAQDSTVSSDNRRNVRESASQMRTFLEETIAVKPKACDARLLAAMMRKIWCANDMSADLVNEAYMQRYGMTYEDLMSEMSRYYTLVESSITIAYASQQKKQTLVKKKMDSFSINGPLKWLFSSKKDNNDKGKEEDTRSSKQRATDIELSKEKDDLQVELQKMDHRIRQENPVYSLFDLLEKGSEADIQLELDQLNKELALVQTDIDMAFKQKRRLLEETREEREQIEYEMQQITSSGQTTMMEEDEETMNALLYKYNNTTTQPIEHHIDELKDEVRFLQYKISLITRNQTEVRNIIWSYQWKSSLFFGAAIGVCAIVYFAVQVYKNFPQGVEATWRELQSSAVQRGFGRLFFLLRKNLPEIGWLDMMDKYTPARVLEQTQSQIMMALQNATLTVQNFKTELNPFLPVLQEAQTAEYSTPVLKKLIESVLENYDYVTRSPTVENINIVRDNIATCCDRLFNLMIKGEVSLDPDMQKALLARMEAPSTFSTFGSWLSSWTSSASEAYVKPSMETLTIEGMFKYIQRGNTQEYGDALIKLAKAAFMTPYLFVAYFFLYTFSVGKFVATGLYTHTNPVALLTTTTLTMALQFDQVIQPILEIAVASSTAQYDLAAYSIKALAYVMALVCPAWGLSYIFGYIYTNLRGSQRRLIPKDRGLSEDESVTEINKLSYHPNDPQALEYSSAPNVSVVRNARRNQERARKKKKKIPPPNSSDIQSALCLVCSKPVTLCCDHCDERYYCAIECALVDWNGANNHMKYC